MNVDEIFEEWKKDCKIDTTQLMEVIRQIPLIHGKYLRYLSVESGKLRQLDKQKSKLYQLLISYYRGELNGTDTLKEVGWEPFKLQIIGRNTITALTPYIEADKHYQDMQIKLDEQKEKISILSSILKEIGNRNFHVRALIDLKKLEGNII